MWPSTNPQFKHPTSFVAPPNAMLANASSFNPSNAWYPHSEASYHVIANSPFSTADQIFM
ncbi:hypothetical protein A2U01_0014046, partial [Trifolium medium]|nr:hypothetical protein [Trifolium medium]